MVNFINFWLSQFRSSYKIVCCKIKTTTATTSITSTTNLYYRTITLTMSRNTFLVSVLAAASISLVVESAPGTSRIVGGNQAQVGDYPYFVEMGVCGGALVAPDVILFAAHCDDLSDRQVNIGAYRKQTTEEGAQGRFCEEWIQDPLYNEDGYDYDFALCKLDKPVVIDDTEVELAINFDDEDFLTVGDDLLVMGLGYLEEGGAVPEYLQDVTVPYISNEECNGENLYQGFITDNMMCAGIPITGGRDSCQGDSGGPLVKRTIKSDGSILDTHVGVVSWGYGCADNWPGVYSRTSKRANWIKDTICNDLQSIAPFCETRSPESDIECDGEDLSITFTTNDDASSIAWRLLDSSRTEVKTRYYLIKDLEYETTMCLKLNECYLWFTGDWGGGSYAFKLNGEEILSGSTFETRKTETFCTGTAVAFSESPTTEYPTPFTSTEYPTQVSTTEYPTQSPTDSPTDGIVCKDKRMFRFGRKKCRRFVKGSRRKMKKRCKMIVKGTVVSESCSRTCGIRVGVGKCASLRANKL